MRRVLTLFGTQIILWAIVAQTNHALGGLRVYLWPGALYVVYAALMVPFGQGVTLALLAGMMCDANTPVTFGTHTLLFAAAHAFLFHLRDRLPREDTTSRVVIALLANLALFLLFSFIQVTRSPAPAAVWPRLIADLIWSQIFLTLVAPWFFALQYRSLILTGAERLPVT